MLTSYRIEQQATRRPRGFPRGLRNPFQVVPCAGEEALLLQGDRVGNGITEHCRDFERTTLTKRERSYA